MDNPTMLSPPAGSIPTIERIVTCEVVFELRIPHRDARNAAARIAEAIEKPEPMVPESFLGG